MALTINGSSLQDAIDNITTAPVGGVSSVDVTADYLSDDIDSYWNITASGGSIATIIIEIAGFANTNVFGVYNGNDYVQIFDGSASAGTQSALSIHADGSVFVNFADTGVDFDNYNFGYYLTAIGQFGANDPRTYHSDTSMNADGWDHMAAYQGTSTDTLQITPFAPGLWTDNEFILAFEDLWEGGDEDYSDFVVMVESVKPVPEPATMILFGAGLLGLAGLGRKKFLKK